MTRDAIEKDMPDAEKLVAWVHEAGAEISNAHAMLDKAGVSRGEGEELSLSQRIRLGLLDALQLGREAAEEREGAGARSG